MTEKQKSCPQCGSDMNYRLGMFECPQCGHEEDDKVLAAPAAEASGPGFRREQWQRSAPRQPGQPGQVPPPQSVGTIYTPGAAPPAGFYSAEPSGYNPYPSLQVEKIIYFALQVAGFLLVTIGLFAFTSMMGSVPELGDIGISMGAIAFFMMIGGLISLGLYWFVLFGEQVWAKYCCGGCVAIGILFTLPGMFMAAPKSSYGMPSSPGLDIFSGILGILMNLWLLSILWRDVQRLQGH